ncbi:MAG: hypothetical protein MZW92_08925 [Comamonadaceae bacterium]|nr:hypothetical protein [Comamonadaceae bacterium]
MSAGSRRRIAKQQERIAHLQRFIDRFKAKATQGQAGAEPRQGAGAHGEAGAGADRQRLRVRVPRAGQPAQPDAGARRPGLRLRPHGRSSAASTARCWPASASASWAPTARASRRW